MSEPPASNGNDLPSLRPATNHRKIDLVQVHRTLGEFMGFTFVAEVAVVGWLGNVMLENEIDRLHEVHVATGSYFAEYGFHDTNQAIWRFLVARLGKIMA
jgi:hypothetical protein